MAQTNDQGDDGQEVSGTATNASTTSNDATSTTPMDAATIIDKDFDPSAQALIDEIDDERTLEEEEALAEADSNVVQNELDDLKRESEMPIEELLAYYERMRNEAPRVPHQNDDEDSEECGDEDLDEEEYEDDDGCDDGDDEGSEQEGLQRSDHDAAPPPTEYDKQSDSARNPRLVQIPLESGGGYLLEGNEETQQIFRAILANLDSSDDLDDDLEDYSYSSNEEDYDDPRSWRRIIHVGPEHQAEVPDELSSYEDDLPPYENEDVLVWKCNPEQSQEEILDYLKQASVIPKRNDISLSPASVPKISNHYMRLYREKTQDAALSSSGSQFPDQEHNRINDKSPGNQTDIYMQQSRKRLRIEREIARDIAMDGVQSHTSVETNMQVNNPLFAQKSSNSDSQDSKPELSTEEYFQGEEQLLYLLLQCNHNFKEALRRRALDPFKYYISEPMSLWSQEECLGFENGLRAHGKNFRLIRENKVPTRTRAEVVAFYYLWKKSERHDVYTNQYKLDRKRCLTHPGTTDYMEKFIEDNESALNSSWSTHTPTPTDCTVENNQNSQSSHVDISAPHCHTSGSEAPPIARSNPSADISTTATDCKDQVEPHQQSNGDEITQENPLPVGDNSPIK